ncbi:MAG: TRAP transporter large permease [Natronospirillum sp.]|uniref:TRAP transporter large permease n=1 Tax=Natronospirillum sp. TaxID=2812955 RepID=UPI0025DF1380|nr:TRAP transporter large permease [Natronospirillum sp.]MCH8550734.1 TRAP transporter large permease [Natronospirillum sp.]
MLYYLSIGILVLLLLSIPVAVTLLILALGLDLFFSNFPLTRALGQTFWSSANSFLLLAIPLFVLMGQLIVKSGIAHRAYEALDNWLSWLPGGLLHSNVLTSTLFSATSGSSVATAATISTVALPQQRALKYDPRLFVGTIAAGGTLGIIIPPSVNLIVYGFLTETSIPRLFMAGLIPGLLMAGLFVVASALICWYKPELGGPKRTATWGQRFFSLLHLLPLLFLFVVIIGSIYAGLATPSESAAVGVIGALVLAACYRKLTWSNLLSALDGTIKTTTMILFIIMAASFLNFAMSASGLSQQLVGLINAYDLTDFQLLLFILLLFIILGFFIETLSLMVIMIPIVTPILFAVGFDPVWFGILMIIFVELALITPPVGLNLYIVQAARKGEPFNDVLVGVIPYIIVMLLMAALLIAYPQIALWLPDRL